MTDWRIQLRDADRALGEDLPPGTAQRLRRSVLASAAGTRSAGYVWSRTFAATAAALALACVGLLTALQGVEVDRPHMKAAGQAEPGPLPVGDADPAPERQQLQFSTPGGTRIIWVFDPGFEVKGTLP